MGNSFWENESPFSLGLCPLTCHPCSMAIIAPMHLWAAQIVEELKEKGYEVGRSRVSDGKESGGGVGVSIIKTR